MRSYLSLLTMLLLLASLVAPAQGQAFLGGSRSFQLRSRTNQQLQGPYTIADGTIVKVGAEEFSVVVPQWSGTVTHDGKKRAFRSIIGLQPISNSGWLHGLTDDLVLNRDYSRQAVIPWAKIASIKITESRDANGLKYLAEVFPHEGKSEVFLVYLVGLEIEWTDSIARDRVSLSSMAGSVIELDKRK